MEYFLYPISATQAKRVAIPRALKDAERAAFIANPPQSALDEAETVPYALPEDTTPTATTQDPAED